MNFRLLHTTCNFSYSVVSGTSAKQEVSWNFWLRTVSSLSTVPVIWNFAHVLTTTVHHRHQVLNQSQAYGMFKSQAGRRYMYTSHHLVTTAINNVKWLICGDDPKNLAYQWALLPTCTLSRPFKKTYDHVQRTKKLYKTQEIAHISINWKVSQNHRHVTDGYYT